MAARLHNPQQNSVAMQALETLKKSRQEKMASVSVTPATPSMATPAPSAAPVSTVAAQGRHLSVPPFKPIPNVGIPISNRPVRLSPIPAFQALPASIARVGSVGPETDAVVVPVAVVRAPVAFKNALNVATSNFQVTVVRLNLSKGFGGAEKSQIIRLRSRNFLIFLHKTSRSLWKLGELTV